MTLNTYKPSSHCCTFPAAWSTPKPASRSSNSPSFRSSNSTAAYATPTAKRQNRSPLGDIPANSSEPTPATGCASRPKVIARPSARPITSASLTQHAIFGSSRRRRPWGGCLGQTESPRPEPKSSWRPRRRAARLRGLERGSEGNNLHSVSDGHGAFTFPAQFERFTLIAKRDDGYAEVTRQPDSAPVELKLQPGRVSKVGFFRPAKRSPTST